MRYAADGPYSAYAFLCFGRIDAAQGRLDEGLENFRSAIRVYDPEIQALCRRYFCPGFNDYFVALATALAACGSLASSDALRCEVTKLR